MSSVAPDLGNIETLLPLFLRHSGAAVAIKDLDGRYLYANDDYAAFAQRSPRDVIGRKDDDVLHPERVARLRAAQRDAIERQASVSVEEELVLEAGPALFISTHFPIPDEQQRPVAVGVVALKAAAPPQDPRTAERALELAATTNARLEQVVRDLEQMASTDTLTGAWNRRRFEEAVEMEIHRAARECRPLSLMMVDIDHFKKVNDSFGHQAGDRVLVELATLLKDSVRKSDSVTRWGGEEFVVMLPNTGADAAVALANRIRRRIETQVFTAAGRVTASFGVAEFVALESWQGWLRRSDEALYRAKERGRNRVELSIPADTAVEIETRLDGHFVKLAWKPRFESGHAEIDRQHASLVRGANELLAAVLSSRPNGHVLDLADQLIDEIRRHFAFEEALLAEIGYDDREAHAAEHAALVGSAERLAEAIRTGQAPVGELFQYLAYEMIMRHMLGTDRHYFALLRSHEARATAE